MNDGGRSRQEDQKEKMKRMERTTKMGNKRRNTSRQMRTMTKKLSEWNSIKDIRI